MRGRKPVPTRIKLLNGNPGKRPISDAEPSYRKVSSRAPKHLDECAKAEWKRVVKLLTGSGVLTQADEVALCAYCQVYSRWVEAENKVREFGTVLVESKENAKGEALSVFRINPYLRVASEALMQMKAFIAEFGMTPSSRSRLHVEPKSKEKDDLAIFLGEAQ